VVKVPHLRRYRQRKITASRISVLESGHRGASFETVQRLADALEVDPLVLMGEAVDA
jgi:transcriptional regulator with XRE-family HTH domain